MASYRTPGVYVEERSVFPPSVAQVETAIPAFIGYTERADDRSRNDLHLKPKKVSSLLDYRLYFGGPPPLNIASVMLNSNNALAEASVQPKYNLYDSLQLFFLNGGGDCYIISVGRYGEPIQLGDRANPTGSPGLDVGLAELEKEDEPTIIVFPDAVLLSNATDLYTLQRSALAQCNSLKDRVAVFDLREHDNAGIFDWTGQKDAFRNNIGTNFLRYGAAYTPHVRTNLPKQVQYRDFRNNLVTPNRFTQAGSAISLLALTNDNEIQAMMSRVEDTANDLDLLANEYTGTDAAIANTAPEGTLLNRAASAYGFTLQPGSRVADVIAFLHNEAIVNATTINQFRTYVDFLYEIVIYLDGWLFDTSSVRRTTAAYKTDAQATAFSPFLAVVERLVAFDKGANAALTAAMNRFVQTAAGTPNVPGRIVANSNYTPTVDFTNAAAGPAANTAVFAGANDTERRRNALPTLRNIAEQLLASANALVATASNRYSAAENALIDQFPLYKNLLAALNATLSTLPPSGAIAGVYAQVDNNRGVWKAPANVSLNGVAELTINFALSQTDDLNIDTQFGKSINAIKYMTGMGFMVWGARTLAGNDNEWRYISVRRFFNMVEESVKKSTLWAVFEPNDANTWIKVKGMIENFLTLQWRAGAVQGAKPDDAFFVNVGLGKTMTSVDILEGRMNVEIGMAVVRPAEFIILTFSHKMVVSG